MKCDMDNRSMNVSLNHEESERERERESWVETNPGKVSTFPGRPTLT